MDAAAPESMPPNPFTVQGIVQSSPVILRKFSSETRLTWAFLAFRWIPTHRSTLAEWIEHNPSKEVTVDINLLRRCVLAISSLLVRCGAGARDSLLNGAWDPLDELLSASSEVDQVAQQLAYV